MSCSGTGAPLQMRRTRCSPAAPFSSSGGRLPRLWHPHHNGTAPCRCDIRSAAAPGDAAAAAQSTTSTAAAAAAVVSSSNSSSSSDKPRMAVYFKSEDIVTEASPGDVIMEVAERCGITIPGGCYSGNCGICEVEVRKLKDASPGASAAAGSGPGAVVRACVARLPPGYAHIEIDALQDDQIWGLDGFDT